ncbi:BamA/TamA family outer membrane protein [Myxococcus sp. K15C18031901]|uniref:BamA/TamA family outer membrane protein n=1 Tax=Myxococcus dinghuensis TaxID=2906761 RepID=UPI0020A73CE6|nr:BamA/TamA family outer membrane protein [Myxococcus dinghuensis]MCP3103368.1 BamA/TamA family outer membrane protein [Myxococcus dinghuensis]
MRTPSAHDRPPPSAAPRTPAHAGPRTPGVAPLRATSQPLSPRLSGTFCPIPPQAWMLLALQLMGMPDVAHAQEAPSQPAVEVEVSQVASPPEGPLPEAELVPGRIERIDIEGNARTQDAVILRALRTLPGELLTRDAGPELKRRLLNLKLFKSVAVRSRPEGEGVVLQVQVDERWTLLPIPMFTSSKGQWQVGLFALETNLFGLNKTFVLGALAGNRGGNVFSLYRDPGIAGTRWTASLFGQYAKLDRERRVRDVVVEEYTDRRVDASATLGYQFLPELNVGAGVFTLLNKPLPRAAGGVAPERSDVFGVSVSAEYLGQDFHFYFNEGPLARLSFRQGLEAIGSTRAFRQVSAFAGYTLSVFGKQSLTLLGSFERVWGDPTVHALLLGGRTGSRGFTKETLWAEQAATATLEYQVPLWSPSMATFTAHAFLDVGRVAWKNARLRYAAPGAGLRVYLRSVAVPALGLDFTREPQTGEFVVNFAAGLSM